MTLFDNVLLLAAGQVMYNSATATIDDYLSSLGSPTPRHANPADHAIQLVNTEFYSSSLGGLSAEEHLDDLALRWQEHERSKDALGQHSSFDNLSHEGKKNSTVSRKVNEGFRKTWILTDRNFKNYTRNLLAFGIRFGMYIGMGLLLALVWIRLGTSSDKINDRLSVQ